MRFVQDRYRRWRNGRSGERTCPRCRGTNIADGTTASSFECSDCAQTWRVAAAPPVRKGAEGDGGGGWWAWGGADCGDSGGGSGGGGDGGC